MFELKEKVHKKIKKLKKHIKKAIKKFNKNVLFSIGENCLADNILARNGLKSFSSPYASARSNIEYLIAFEKESFKDFLKNDYIVYVNPSESKIAQNKKYVEVENSYHNSCINGFEFTHHDVIGDDKMREMLKKRYKRLLKIKNKNIVLLYHHRFCENTNEEMLIAHLKEFADIYRKRGNDVNIFIFTQVIVSSEDYRKVEKTVVGGINVYKFYTMNIWGGEDDEILWARCDNDLLEEMINDMKKKLI